MNKYFSAYTNKKMLITLLLGFSGGLPLALTLGTMQAWLSDAGVGIAAIGQFSLVGLPYALKFLWAPIIDSVKIPGFGLRRGWMLLTQGGLFISTIALAIQDPKVGLPVFSMLAVLVAFFSASQDIVIDAYRTEIIDKKEDLGPAASTYISGYRIAMVISGGAAVAMADYMSWTSVYIIMAMINLVGLVTILFSHEPQVQRPPRRLSVQDMVVSPFLEFFQRQGAMEILIFIMVYKISTLMATALTTKFLMDMAFTKTAIGSVTKGVGIFATIGGTLAGGGLMIKYGLKRSLFIFGVLQAVAGLTFCTLTYLGGASEFVRWIALGAVICTDNFMMGMGTAALSGFMMNFANKQYTGTQLALLTSVMAVSRVVLVAHAGTIIEKIGYNWFFIGTIPLAIPGLLLLNRFDHWQTVASEKLARVSKIDMALIVLFVISLFCLSSDPLWQWLGRKEEAVVIAKIGAFGVLAVVFIGLVRPYIKVRTESVKIA